MVGTKGGAAKASVMWGKTVKDEKRSEKRGGLSEAKNAELLKLDKVYVPLHRIFATRD